MSSSDVTNVTSFFPSPNEGFTTTLSGSITAGATSVGLASTSGLTNGQVFVGIIEPGTTSQQVFTGTVDTSGSQITGVVWTRGTNIGHSAGVTIVDYVSGTHIKMMSKGILVAHNQDGTNKSGATYPSPVFTGTATGTYTLGGTPTISSPTISSPTFSGTPGTGGLSSIALTNPYKFRAHSEANQTGIANNTWITVNLGTEDYDTSNNFSSNTFTAPVNGFYQFSGATALTASSLGLLEGWSLRLLKNNATETTVSYPVFDNNWSVDNASCNISDTLQLVAGDTIVLQILITLVSGTGTVVGQPSGTRLSGFLVSAT